MESTSETLAAPIGSTDEATMDSAASIANETTEEMAPPSAEAEAGTKMDDSINAALAVPAGITPVEKAVAPVAAANPAAAPTTVQAAAREQVSQLVERNELDADSSSSLQALFREHEALKDKVSKLKALLGRSAKAQREAKVELDASNKKLEATLKENVRLQGKIDKLASRPTHMELLADFETNFDKAILSVGHNHAVTQAGGQDTSGTALGSSGSSTDAASSPRKDRSIFDPLLSSTSDGAIVDNLLMQELSDSKQRVDKLEKLNAALVHRSSQLEGDLKQAKRSMDDLLNKMSRLELEKRMAVMEAEQASRAMQEKAASLAEMQMEIDLVTKSAQKAAVRAAVGEEMIKTVQSDKLQAQNLEEKVKALQEWAMASNQAKTLAQERVRMLEMQLKRHQNSSKRLDISARGDGSGGADGAAPNAAAENGDNERVLDSKKASLVVGAGDVGMRAFVLDPDLIKSVNFFTERVVLRWTFDLTQDDADIVFSVLKGACETAADRRNADSLIKDRMVKGGAGGEVENAFSIGRACTLVWSNTKSWIRPRTIKYTIQAVVLTD